VEQVVLRLLDHRAVPAVAVGHPRRRGLVGAPLAGAPVQGLALHDQVVHRAHGLVDRRLRVGAVAVDQVDVLEAEALQRAVHGLHEVLAVQRVLAVDRVALAVQAPEVLRRDDVVQARPAELLQGRAHELLAAPAGVDLGVVEEIDAGVEGRGHHLAADFTSTWLW
jgi:hypothetical protein